MTPTPTTAQSLYRTWRSRTFDEVVGQGHITQTLRNAVRTNSVGHAYLLTGPRGTGKTSTARILARAVNCLQPREGEPCNVCGPCQSILTNRSLDVMEIDAASKSKVDEMRDVIDKVGYAPTEVRRKVYIVDEVHMLSASAFNALLKTLEEPPAHAIFMLATTDAHKVPATITSRCQRLDFRTISARDIVERLAYVCAQEGMQAEPAALEIIAQQATGSLRDALSLLEQVRAYEDAYITVTAVEDALGLARRETLAGLAESIVAGDAGAALALVGDLAAAGTDMRQYAKQLVQYWRDLLLLRVGATGRSHQDGASDPAMAALAARLTPADITTVLKAILQPDYSGRRSASAQWQLELAVVEASAHVAGSDSRPAQAAPPFAQPQAPRPREVSAPAPSPAAHTLGQAAGPPVMSAPVTAALAANREPPAAQSRAAQSVGPMTGRNGVAGEGSASLAVPPAKVSDPIPVTPEPDEQRPRETVFADSARIMAEPERLPAAGTVEETDPMSAPGSATDESEPPAVAMPASALTTPATPATVAVAGEQSARSPAPAYDANHDANQVWALVREHEAVRGKPRLKAVLNGSCVPGGLDGDAFVLLFDARDTKSAFMQHQVMAQQNRGAIEQALTAVVGRAVTLRCDTLRQQSPIPAGGGQDHQMDLFVDEAARRLRAIHIDR